MCTLAKWGFSSACHTYLVVLEAGGLGEAVELGLVGVAEAGLDAGQNREKVKKYTKNNKYI